MIGTLMLRAALGFSFLAFLGYLRSLQTASPQALRIARGAFFVSAFLTVVSAGALLFLILSHQFQYSYVWNFSSRDLPFPLLVSTFYAGQEGSFHLWGLYAAALGVLLIRFSGKRGYEAAVMVTVAAALAALQLMLVIKNPYALLSDSMTGLAGKIPLDGRGLNPLLQNYWMVIHPPVLFLGFTFMLVPYAFAIAALLKKDFQNWIGLTLPWLSFGAMILGFGIILGGFWAYETLGWGGYWAWDPVENSSFIPWLVSIALIHTMLVQKRGGGLVRTNLLLAFVPFVLVLYSTFLTRSGVLGDTSVHSFVEPGMVLYWMLLLFVLMAMTIAIIIYLFRIKGALQHVVKYSISSRELILYLGSTSLLFLSIFVAVGTSAPLLTGIFQGKPSAVDMSYYVSTSLPLAFIILLLSGIGQIAIWGGSPWRRMLEKAAISVSLALAVIVVCLLYGFRQFTMLLLIFAAVFSLAVNLQIGIRKYVKNLRLAASATAHVGVAVLMLGVVASSKYDRKQIVTLEQGQSQRIFNSNLTYMGFRALERGRFAFDVHVERDGKTRTVSPVMFENVQNGELIRTPDILSSLTKDLYVAPVNLELAADRPDTTLTLVKGKKVSAGTVGFVYRGYEISSDSAMGNVVTLSIDIERGASVETIQPKMLNKRGDVSSLAAQTADGNIRLLVGGMNLNAAEASASFDIVFGGNGEHREKKDVLIAEISTKPLILLVWSGALLIVLGLLLAVLKRRKGEKPRNSSSDQSVSEKNESTPIGSME